MKKNKWILLLIVLIGVLGVFSVLYAKFGTTYMQAKEKEDTENTDTQSKKTEDEEKQKEAAKDFEVYDENGNKVRLSDYFGRPVVVNFWASWCPPCKREMPAFQKMTEKYGEEITFLMINETDGERETKESALAFLNENNYNMNVLFDQDEEATNTYHIMYLPRTLFIDEDGNITEDHSGTMTEEELEKNIKKIKIQESEQNKRLDEYKNVSVIYTFGETTEVLDFSQIRQWLQPGKKEVKIDEEKVKAYVADLASRYDTIYRDRTFQTSSGETVTISGNEYGYQIDQENEKQQLMTDIQNKVPVQREPVYAKSGLKRNGLDDLEGSYVEVSLERQHLWLYKDGALVTETDIISGLPTQDRSTYKGAWPIAYKASPYTLSSEEYGYSTKVQYWMPFVCGQGLHDASWQTEFGGEVYKTKGSHGCVNLPPAQAEVIYNTVEAGYPIIIY